MRISDWSSDVCSSDLLHDIIHMAAKRGVIIAPQDEFDGCHQRRGRHIAEGIVRHAGDIHHVGDAAAGPDENRSAEHTSELQSLMRISYAVFCLKKTILKNKNTHVLPSITHEHQDYR